MHGAAEGMLLHSTLSRTGELGGEKLQFVHHSLSGVQIASCVQVHHKSVRTPSPHTRPPLSATHWWPHDPRLYFSVPTFELSIVGTFLSLS